MKFKIIQRCANMGYAITNIYEREFKDIRECIDECVWMEECDKMEGNEFYLYQWELVL